MDSAAGQRLVDSALRVCETVTGQVNTHAPDLNFASSFGDLRATQRELDELRVPESAVELKAHRRVALQQVEQAFQILEFCARSRLNMKFRERLQGLLSDTKSVEFPPINLAAACLDDFEAYSRHWDNIRDWRGGGLQQT